MTSENILGDCKSYKNCTVITLGLKSKKIKPENITFCKKQFLEVCCPRKVNLTTPKPLDIQSERISERKCRENSNYTLKIQLVAGLIGQEPSILKLNNCKHNSVPLIVGGSVAQTSEFPHQALLGYVEKTEVKWKCGGSIISSDFILTAAHCTRNVTFVKVGMHSRLTDGPNTATYRVKSIIIHPSYKSLLNDEDIALIQLQKNIKFNEYVYPICLPTKQIDHQRALVTGFGNLGNGFYSENLMKVVVEKFEYNECKDLYDPKPIFRDTMLCYGDKSNSKDSCDGDSGGPLQVSNENNVNCTYTQIGIVSFGSSQCGLKGFPVIIFQTVASAELALHSRCITSENLPGICMEFRKCKIVVDAITVQSYKPTICSNQEQTVCCPYNSPVNVRNSADRTTARFEENTKILEIRKDESEEMPLRDSAERISERKCREYGQAVIHTIKIAPTLIGGKPHEIKVDKCKHKPVALIVGGTEAKLFEFPHQGLIGYGKKSDLKFKCGCSLISPRFVLTAAHCLEVPLKNKILTPKAVKLGSISRFGDNDKTVVVDVEETFQYDHYTRNSSTVIGDLALLKLAEDVTINEYILPICLPTKQHDDEKGIVTGFGVTEDGVVAQNLMKVTLERFSHEECQGLWKSKIIDDHAMICYGHHTEEKDSCKGDSGGPLFVSNGDKVSCTYTQIGIVSFGLRQCGTIGFPGVYVNVYNFLDWIEGIVWKDEI